jgi:phospholipid/cholesterol/gamma-HCH transport system ATP-binding protein
MSEAALPASAPIWREAAPGEPLVIFRDVHITFDEGEILRGVSFSVFPGETKVLLGISGVGKTVLMKLAAGLLKPNAGEIRVMGHEVSQMPERELLEFRRHIGFVFQEGALFDSMTVADNVSFRLHEDRLPYEEIESRTREALCFVELEAAYDKFPAELSGGMRRRVSIARALIDRPILLFCDSPTAGLDPVTSQTIINLIIRGRDSQGVTTLLATHRVQDAFGLANYRFDAATGTVVPSGSDGGRPPMPPTTILVLRDGRVYFEGLANNMLESTDEYLKEFLASAE